MPAITQAPASFHSPAQHATAKQACNVHTKRAPKLHCLFFFRSLMHGGWGRRSSVAPQAGSAALGIHGVDLHTKKMVLLMSSFWSQERPYISPVSSLVSCVPQRSCKSGKNRHFISICSQIILICNSPSRGATFLFFAGPRRAGPSRSI